jgi:hypothetical protein
LIGGQAFLQCELGVFLFSPRPCQQSAVHCFLLQGTIQGPLPGPERLGSTQKFLRLAESNPEQQSSTFMGECFSHAESQVHQTIHLRPRWGVGNGNLHRFAAAVWVQWLAEDTQIATCVRPSTDALILSSVYDLILKERPELR